MKRNLLILSLLIIGLTSCKKDKETKPKSLTIESVSTITVGEGGTPYYQDEITILATEQPTVTSTLTDQLAEGAFVYKMEKYKFIYRTFRLIKSPYTVTISAAGETKTVDVE